MRKTALLALLLPVLIATGVLCAGPVRSGPGVGQKVPGPFRPLHITGPEAGKRVCLYCKYGPRPVAVVFAREITPAVARLLAVLDGVTAARQDARLASFAVFVGDTSRTAAPVKQLAEARGIRHCILTVDDEAPKSYEIAGDAAVTVLLYRRHTVKANHAFRSGELDSKAIDAILADLNRLVAAE
jgi:hypothetical protein